ncbi:MATE efflux family protein 2, chloroplastic-like [Gossypium australe]|uniref:MATE efflux family protein 2, chloroplastic-like n=1 Tax=Gossypium australe TaxID=47621 RepID=A0A5B6UYA4_9ROSI|nr:MATE efflux family protein 2, chloroplastic-like [Gossypium australe]
MLAQKYVRKGCEAYLAYVLNTKVSKLKIESMPVVCEYPNVFLEELLALPLIREVEFTIEVVPGTSSISIAPYRMIPTELKELKAQLQELTNRGFARPRCTSAICKEERWIDETVYRLSSAQQVGVNNCYPPRYCAVWFSIKVQRKYISTTPRLLHELLKKLDAELKHVVCHWATYYVFFRKTFSGKHTLSRSVPSHFISSLLPLHPSTSASHPHRCASSFWVINSLWCLAYLGLLEFWFNVGFWRLVLGFSSVPFSAPIQEVQWVSFFAGWSEGANICVMASWVARFSDSTSLVHSKLCGDSILAFGFRGLD